MKIAERNRLSDPERKLVKFILRMIAYLWIALVTRWARNIYTDPEMGIALTAVSALTLMIPSMLLLWYAFDYKKESHEVDPTDISP